MKKCVNADTCEGTAKGIYLCMFVILSTYLSPFLK